MVGYILDVSGNDVTQIEYWWEVIETFIHMQIELSEDNRDVTVCI